MPAKILLLSGASDGPVLARALLDAGAVHDLDITTLMIRRPPEDDLRTVSTLEAAVQVCRDVLHGVRAGQGGV